jgi:four helix bundle protein
MLTNTRHHSLIAWQRADDLFIKLHLLALKHFPEFEKLELGKQLRWAAYSVPANIVQGFAERSKKARLNFLNIAEASLAEVGYWSFLRNWKRRSMASARRWGVVVWFAA